MKIFCCTILFLSVLSSSFAGQKELMEKNASRLIDLNNAVLKNADILGKYNNKDVYVRAKVIEKDEKYEIEIEKISTEKIPETRQPGLDDINNDIILWLKGKVRKGSDNSYRLDIDKAYSEGNASQSQDKKDDMPVPMPSKQ